MAGIETRVARIAEATLAEQQFVTPIDVLIGIGWLAQPNVDRWMKGRVTSLDHCISVDDAKTAAASCDDTGDLLVKAKAGALCLECANLGHLVFLPSGDAALTRRAKKASRLSAVVVRWSTQRKRYERQGILAENDAIEHAAQQCLADADARALRRNHDQVAPRSSRRDVPRRLRRRHPRTVPRLPTCPRRRDLLPCRPAR